MGQLLFTYGPFYKTWQLAGHFQ